MPLPRRMYAGGRIGESSSAARGRFSVQVVTRRGCVTYKEGRSGPLVFVRVRHRISNGTGLALIEDQDITSTEGGFAAGRVGSPAGVAPGARELDPRGSARRGPVVPLFRALTFNGHRIHYDRHLRRRARVTPVWSFTDG